MTENLAETNDYDSLTRGKLCPLKANRPPALAFWNLDPAPDVTATLKAGVIECRADGEPPRVEYIGGQCDGPRCAWYDQTAGRCAVLSIARINDNTPACSWWSGPGLLYALRGAPRASVRRFMRWEYRDTAGQ